MFSEVYQNFPVKVSKRYEKLFILDILTNPTKSYAVKAGDMFHKYVE